MLALYWSNCYLYIKSTLFTGPAQRQRIKTVVDVLNDSQNWEKNPDAEVAAKQRKSYMWAFLIRS